MLVPPTTLRRNAVLRPGYQYDEDLLPGVDTLIVIHHDWVCQGVEAVEAAIKMGLPLIRVMEYEELHDVLTGTRNEDDGASDDASA